MAVCKNTDYCFEYTSFMERKIRSDIATDRTFKRQLSGSDELFTFWTCVAVMSQETSKLGLTDDPTYERCLQEDESATHILCDCEAIAYLRFRHLGQFFIEPSGYYDAPIIKSYTSFGV
jgi:hypothetical protein